MIEALYAHDSPAWLREYDAHIARQEMAEAQYQERLVNAAHDCLAALETNAVSTFDRYDFLQSAQAGELFQELANLIVARVIHGDDSGASYEAMGRAAEAWIEAEVKAYAESVA